MTSRHGKIKEELQSVRKARREAEDGHDAGFREKIKFLQEQCTGLGHILGELDYEAGGRFCTVCGKFVRTMG